MALSERSTKVEPSPSAGSVAGGPARTRFAFVADRLAEGLRSSRAIGLATLLGVLLVVLALRLFGVIEPLEMASYDILIRLRAEGDGVDSRVVQVSILEDDLQRFGWPLSDGLLAKLIETLRADKPLALGVDVFRPVPVAPGTDALDRTIRDTPQLVWVSRFGEAGWAGVPPPAAALATGRLGFSDLVLDHGGYARRALLYLNDDKNWQEAFSLKLALLYLAAQGVTPTADADQWLRLGHVSLPALDSDLGGYVDVDARGYQILREFRAPARVASFSLSDVMDGKVPPDRFANRIVVIGVVADSVKDFFTTPLDRQAGRGTPGATIQALFAAQLLQHALDGVAPTRPLPRTAETGLIAAVTLLGGAAAVFLHRSIRLALVGVMGVLVLLAAAYLAFVHSLWLPVAPLLMGWVFAATVTASAIAHAESAQRSHLMRLFSAYVSEPIAQEIWAKRGAITRHGRPVPRRLTATVMFSDINDFTTVAESLEIDRVLQWLEIYMDTMTRVVDEHGGIVDNFAGDGLLAMWGVPIARRGQNEIAADAVAAVRCALRMREQVLRLNEFYREEGLPEMRIAIGIYSGELLGCTLGTAARQQYAAIGDTTNTASRLVTVGKDVMKSHDNDIVCEIVVGNTTQALIGDSFASRALGAFALKGKSQLIDCYEIHSDAGAPRAEPVSQDAAREMSSGA